MDPIRPPVVPILCWLLAVVSTAETTRGQRTDAVSCAEAVKRFADAFDASKASLDGRIDASRGPHPIYGDLLGSDRALAGVDTHRAALLRLLPMLGGHGQPSGLCALVRLAAVGNERPLLDRETAEVRARARRFALGWNEVRHWSHVALLVEGEQDCAPAVRAAATELLGRATGAEYASSLTRALGGGSDEVRLAAAEALRRSSDLTSLGPMVRALRVEPHPITARVLAEACDAGLLRAVRDHEDRLARPAAVRAAMHALGRHGWRCDFALVELLEGHPVPEVVPTLIRVLEHCQMEGDDLEKALNERAREILARRAHLALRRLTGALEPAEPDALAWRRFWEAEQHRLVLPDCPALSDDRAATRGGFFGIPVAGREIAFVIDISGSMGETTQVQDRDGEHRISRLELARREMLRAVQTLDPTARYHLFTFAGQALVWNHVPVPPNAESHRQLANCLAHIEANDSTDLHAAIAAIFEAAGDPQDPEAAKAPRIDEVFLLSDGEPSTGEVTDPEVLLELVERANAMRGIRFHCVHLGGGGGAALLGELARRNDGVFVQR